MILTSSGRLRGAVPLSPMVPAREGKLIFDHPGEVEKKASRQRAFPGQHQHRDAFSDRAMSKAWRELQDSIEGPTGQPASIAPVLVFLASDDADYVRGIIQTE